MKQDLIVLKEQLEQKHASLLTKRILAGFDGFVDSIQKVIARKYENSKPAYFNTIEEFGNYISQKKGSGFSLETIQTNEKLGGNMPILANAAAGLGIKVNCIGALGSPELHPAFLNMHPDCSLYSYANPGLTSAYEFNDGKIMMAQMKDLKKANWKVIKTAIGLSKIKDLFSKSDLICLLNWSELDGSNDIWKGLLNEIFSSTHFSAKKKQLFFDLSDCSTRSSSNIREALNLIKQFKKFCSITISLNSNEAKLIYKTLFPDDEMADINLSGTKIYNALLPNTLIIHTAKQAVAWNKTSTYNCNSFYVEVPNISTGAGDNFNAGYCAAQLMGMHLPLSLLLANVVSGYYIQNCKSPDIPQLLNHIQGLISKPMINKSIKQLN